MSANENGFRLCRARYITKDGAYREKRLWLRYDGYMHYAVTLEVPLQGNGYVYAHIFNYTNIRYNAELSFIDQDDREPIGVRLRAPHDHGGLTKEELPIYIEELRLAEDARVELTRRFCNGGWMVERDKVLTTVLPLRSIEVEQEFQASTDANRVTDEDYELTFYAVGSAEKYTLHFDSLLEAILLLMNKLHELNSNRAVPYYSHADIKKPGCKEAVFFGTWENGRTGTNLTLSDPDYLRVQPYLSQSR